MVDLVPFWTNAWSMREGIALSFVPLLIGTIIAGIYYLSASLILPQDFGEWPNLDDHFLRHKGHVTLGVMAASTLVKCASTSGSDRVRDFRKAI